MISTAPAPSVAASAAAPAPVQRPNAVFLTLLGLLWVWSVWICSRFWSTDDNYSYGFVVPPLILFFLWRRLGAQTAEFWQAVAREAGRGKRFPSWLLAIPALAIFPVEVYRSEYHQSGIVLWAINVGTVALTLAGAWWTGGRRFFVLMLFPFLFYLTSVPWPAKIAHPLQQNLMIGVAQVVTEILLWLGVPVKAEGAVLHLTKGTVGIVEACSGIRSLQSGLMVSLAVGELLMLPRLRRATLVGSAVLLALISNFGRTFTLCWIMENHGEHAMEKAHDTVGNIAMYSFYALIWLVGKLLSRGFEHLDRWPTGSFAESVAGLRSLRWSGLPDFRPFLGAALLMFAVVHGWYLALRFQAKPQTEPLFATRFEDTLPNRKLEWEERVWGTLKASTGENIRHTNSIAPLGFIDGYHLFWRPGPDAKTALHHRPDSCMPGSGWKQVGSVGQTNVVINGQTLNFYVFRFEKQNLKGVTYWGVWRNGQTIEMDYSSSFTDLPEVYRPWPSNRHLMGMELVSCFIPYRPTDPEPSAELALKALPQMFSYRSFQAN
jgi:exosortase